MTFITPGAVQQPSGVRTQIPAVFSFSGALSVAAGAGKFPSPATFSIVSVIAAVGTASSGTSIICDVNKNGTTIFTTQANRPTILAGQVVSSLTAPDVITLALADLLSVDIDQIGSGTTGSDLTVVVTLLAA